MCDSSLQTILKSPDTLWTKKEIWNMKKWNNFRLKVFFYCNFAWILQKEISFEIQCRKKIFFWACLLKLTFDLSLNISYYSKSKDSHKFKANYWQGVIMNTWLHIINFMKRKSQMCLKRPLMELNIQKKSAQLSFARLSHFHSAIPKF